jgi:hypothetical protein
MRRAKPGSITDEADVDAARKPRVRRAAALRPARLTESTNNTACVTDRDRDDVHFLVDEAGARWLRDERNSWPVNTPISTSTFRSRSAVRRRCVVWRLFDKPVSTTNFMKLLAPSALFSFVPSALYAMAEVVSGSVGFHAPAVDETDAGMSVDNRAISSGTAETPCDLVDDHEIIAESVHLAEMIACPKNT